MSNKLLSILIIIILTGSLVAQVGLSSANALADPATGIKASSKFGTLQIDHSEYDVTYVNSTIVKVSGTIANLNSIDTKMIIIFTLPDGTTTGSQIAPNGDGTFQTLFPLDSNSQKGTYSVSASYSQNTIGALTFTVKLAPVSKSALPISPPPIKSSQNNPSLGTTDTQQNISVQSIPDSISQSPSKLPKWIKKTFISYAQGDVSEDELLNAITFLVQNNIIKIQSVSQPNITTNTQSETQQATSPSTQTPDNSQPQNQPQTSIQPQTQQSSMTSVSSNSINNFDFRYIHANPDSYKNDWIKFVGKVSHFQPDSNTIQFDINPNSSDYSNEVFVKLMYNYTSQYSEGDCLLIEGHIIGSAEYTYESGTKATNLQMNGEKITKISCIDAVDPAMNTIIVNQSQTLGNVKITLEKVDFTQDYTRVKIIFENLGSSDVNIMESWSHIFQGTSQMDIKYVNGDNVKTSISTGVISEGYLFFEPAKSGKIAVVIDENSWSPSYTENKFTFNVG